MVSGGNMTKTLLLVFIHGFKGGDDTFGTFPEHLRALVSHALPSIRVVATTYPKYETRGDLKECVGRFREWLQNKVIDIEVENQTPSPTVDPSVHVFLVGHSMGGIVGAETILLLASEQPIATPASTVTTTGDMEQPRIVEPGNFMFPHVQGLLAFDTPFLGIAPGVVSYGAEGHYKTATTAYSAFSEVAGLFGYGSNNTASRTHHASTQSTSAAKALPPTAASTASNVDVAEPPSWQRWGRYAMFAGAAGAVAAGGAAALYSQRQRITDGLSWVTSHLEFVGCLARTTELRQRLARLAETHRERGIRSTNFYTCLGKGAPSLVENSNPGKASFSQKIIRSKNRTFCFLPPEVHGAGEPATHPVEQAGPRWRRAVNDKATDEVKAHISMFFPSENPAFYVLAHEACEALVDAVDKGWYNSASVPLRGEVLNTETQRTRGSGPMDIESDDVVIVD